MNIVYLYRTSRLCSVYFLEGNCPSWDCPSWGIWPLCRTLFLVPECAGLKLPCVRNWLLWIEKKYLILIWRWHHGVVQYWYYYGKNRLLYRNNHNEVTMLSSSYFLYFFIYFFLFSILLDFIWYEGQRICFTHANVALP